MIQHERIQEDYNGNRRMFLPKTHNIGEYMTDKKHVARNMIESTFLMLEQSIDRCSENVIDYAYSLGRREEYLTDKDHAKFDSLAKKFYKKCQCNIMK